MTHRILKRWCPFFSLWRSERARHAVTAADLTAHKLHLAVARAQRDRARDLVAALLGDARAFTPGDLAFLDDAGVEAE